MTRGAFHCIIEGVVLQLVHFDVSSSSALLPDRAARRSPLAFPCFVVISGLVRILARLAAQQSNRGSGQMRCHLSAHERTQAVLDSTRGGRTLSSRSKQGVPFHSICPRCKSQCCVHSESRSSSDRGHRPQQQLPGAPLLRQEPNRSVQPPNCIDTESTGS